MLFNSLKFSSKWTVAALAIFAMFCAPSLNRLEATCTYVTDTGGCAYDECRAATNWAPAIALSTLAIVAIIAVAVQNSHGSGAHSHCDSSSSSSCSSSSSHGCNSCRS